MEPQITNCMIGGRKDRIQLRKRFCERAGLTVLPSNRRLSFGFAHYRIAIPADLPKEHALRIARAMKARRQLLKLSHVADALCRYAGRPVGPRPKRLE
ncbi:hypothetical protein OK349_12775 [Sphingomonas sp. BT-65]|uniref:hypothetical protein n=1 Tax=Sphingomonas sp. BT-65 TaxID=2989821 RepID=UPI002235B8AE|nr:hypothetical protein [Sphingomonas sp. BT-65]MCW4462584.1 hypothetical protein [Sphingomonas sp. BT-65]